MYNFQNQLRQLDNDLNKNDKKLIDNDNEKVNINLRLLFFFIIVLNSFNFF